MTVHKKRLFSTTLLITSEWKFEILCCMLSSQRCTITLSLDMAFNLVAFNLVPLNRIGFMYIVTKMCNWKMLRNTTGKCFLPSSTFTHIFPCLYSSYFPSHSKVTYIISFKRPVSNIQLQSAYKVKILRSKEIHNTRIHRATYRTDE